MSWLDFSEDDLITFDGSNIANIQDKFMSTRNYQNGTAAIQPLWDENAALFVPNDYLVSLDDLNIPDEYTVLCTSKVTSTSNRMITSIISDGDHGILIGYQNTYEMRTLHRFPLGTSGGSNIYSPAGFDGFRTTAFTKSETEIEQFIDGVSQGTTPDTTNFSTVTFNREDIGRLHTGLRYFAGHICERVIVKGKVSQNDIDNYHRYASAKWSSLT